MFELGQDGLLGERGYLRNYASLTSKHMNQIGGRFGKSSHNKTTRIMSVRRTDSRPQSILPKTAINFYNLRKGLYLKNGVQHFSVSRQASTGVMNTQERGTTKSTGLLNAYGDLAAGSEFENIGGIATTANLFHHRGGKKIKGTASELQSALTPKTINTIMGTQTEAVVTAATPDTQATPQNVGKLSAVDLSPDNRTDKGIERVADITPVYRQSIAAMQRSSRRR